MIHPHANLSTVEQHHWLRNALGLDGDDSPFPWQEKLLDCFVRNEIPRAIDLPTGLGKTAVMAIWLIARALGAGLPRRLVYVVDRQAVVDQASEEALRLREFVDLNPMVRTCLGLAEGRPLPISTLRGQHIDNREWLADPASPAIVVGTVDMIGSRLLFEGYGVSRKMRSYHAGLLGADTLVVLDEAHLVPPFEMLLRVIAEDTSFGSEVAELRETIPAFRLLPLSATGRMQGANIFELTPQDLDQPSESILKKRLHAKKRLVLQPLKETPLEEILAQRAWELAGMGRSPMRVIVYCNERKVAEKVKLAVEKLAKGDKKTCMPALEIERELFVGARRVFEREKLRDWLKRTGFLAGHGVLRDKPAFLFATSAGEVGVDLGADHMVCDLVAWERMAQRLGRVNRRGEPAAHVAQIKVFFEDEPAEYKKALEKDLGERTNKDQEIVARVERMNAARQLLSKLPRIDDESVDASPAALRQLKLKTLANKEVANLIAAASTPAPLRPALSRAVVDAWSMTSLREHPGRPAIAPWLRGWIENDPPQTRIVWRRYLPVRAGGASVKKSEIAAFFEAAPPHASEILETETYLVVDWLKKRAKAALSAPSPSSEENDEGRAAFAPEHTMAFILTPAGDLDQELRLKDLLSPKDSKAKKALEETLVGKVLVVDARLAGLNQDGLLDDGTAQIPRTADDGLDWLAPEVVRFRIRSASADDTANAAGGWYERLRFAAEVSEEGDPQRWLIIEKLRADAATEEDRSAGRPQLLDEHQSWAETRARSLAKALGVHEYADMLGIAARLHDEGKQAKRWQRAFNAPKDGIYAKTRGPINYALLDGYRHEFGSIPVAETHERLLALPAEQQDLALHLIASHHGFARPLISVAACEDAPPSALRERAAEIARRFARLQERWGPWGLAWWEALLRAADQQASRDNDEQSSGASGKR